MIDAAEQEFRGETKGWKSWRSLLLRIRYREVLILQGPPLMGAALSLRHWTGASLVSIGILFFAGFLLVAHIWSLNDWADLPAERCNPMLGLSLSLLVLSMALFTCLGRTTLLIAIGVALLGFVYSHPAIDAKGKPVFSSVTHLAGGLFHFLLGYSVFSTLGLKAVMTASFFALVFTAGHATQEVQDYEDDRLMGIRTNAVVFGKTAVFIAAFIGFACAYGDFAWLSLSGILPPRLWLMAVALFPLHCYWSLDALRTGLDPDRLRRLRNCYRVLFILIGMAIASGLFAKDLHEKFANYFPHR
jgi:4-hydroxybenzoate polyprenyltransferase